MQYESLTAAVKVYVDNWVSCYQQFKEFKHVCGSKIQEMRDALNWIYDMTGSNDIHMDGYRLNGLDKMDQTWPHVGYWNESGNNIHIGDNETDDWADIQSTVLNNTDLAFRG